MRVAGVAVVQFLLRLLDPLRFISPRGSAPASRQQSHVYKVGRGKGQEHEVRGRDAPRFGGYETRKELLHL